MATFHPEGPPRKPRKPLRILGLFKNRYKPHETDEVQKAHAALVGSMRRLVELPPPESISTDSKSLSSEPRSDSPDSHRT